MFVDACAIVSLLSEEATADAYGVALDAADGPWTSNLAAFEAILVLSRPEKLRLGYPETAAIVLDFLEARAIALRETGEPRAVLLEAVSVAERHGVGRKKLSTFDCFHYASAKLAAQPMLTMDEALRETSVTTVP